MKAALSLFCHELYTSVIGQTHFHIPCRMHSTGILLQRLKNLDYLKLDGEPRLLIHDP